MDQATGTVGKIQNIVWTIGGAIFGWAIGSVLSTLYLVSHDLAFCGLIVGALGLFYGRMYSKIPKAHTLAFSVSIGLVTCAVGLLKTHAPLLGLTLLITYFALFVAVWKLQRGVSMTFHVILGVAFGIIVGLLAKSWELGGIAAFVYFTAMGLSHLKHPL